MAKNKRPNILVIMGDDIGWFNISAYNLGMMGYRTPNIDRLAKEGGLFTDWYGQQSCTAGRAAFVTGQSPIRTGLTKVGLPGAELGLKAEDPTIAGVMKSLGYATGQFGKNHLGDRNEFLPTMHGFDEFFGNLYHLNAEEEPENEDYPKDPKFKARFGPRGILRCKAGELDDETVDPHFGRVGKQVIKNTGPLTSKRMETVDEEFVAASKDFIKRQHKAGKPWFCYHNSTRMHVFTHLKKESAGKTGLGLYPDGMVETDSHVGQLLDLLDELKVADNTIVVYTTDNGAEVMSWPDGGATPFRGEKDTNWEGSFRVPCLIRWPGVIEPGRVVNDMCAHYDFIPTFAAAAGEPGIVEKIKRGHVLNGRSYKAHLDGLDLTAFLKGEEKDSPRKGFLYWSDDGDLMAIRVGNYKMVFKAQDQTGIGVWQSDFTNLRLPYIFNLRSDPFERGSESFKYWDWMVHRAFLLVPAQVIAAQWLESFKEFPPRQKPASFNLQQVVESMTSAAGAPPEPPAPAPKQGRRHARVVHHHARGNGAGRGRVVRKPVKAR